MSQPNVEYNYDVHSSTILSKDGREKSVSLMDEPLKEKERKDKRLVGDAGRNSLGPLHIRMENDIMNLIGVQAESGSDDLQSVFGMVSYFTR